MAGIDQRVELAHCVGMERQAVRFDHLDRMGVAAALTARRQRALVFGSLVLAIGLAWLILAAMATAVAQRTLIPEQGPGDALLRLLPDMPQPWLLERFVALCLSPMPPGTFSSMVLFALWAMWMLMAVAMMLPAAAPMIRTYCEIADTARGRGQAVAHPMVLVMGYLGVWAVAAFLLALAGFAVNMAAARPAAAPVTGMAGAVALAIAGLYQFSGLKEACLQKCRNPFAVLFANWSDRPSRVLLLGVRQGLFCLGCCWALMMVMFAVGVMNVFWMALIGLFAIAERQLAGPMLSRIAGALLLVWAGGLLLVSL